MTCLSLTCAALLLCMGVAVADDEADAGWQADPETVASWTNRRIGNFDEARVRDCSLPDPLVTVSGDPVRDAAAWRETRRPALV